MSSPLPAGYTLRRPTLDDAEAVAELINSCSMADTGVPVLGVEQVRGIWQLPAHNRDTDDWLVDAADGPLVAAAAVVALEPYTEIQSIGVVRHDHLGRGLGTWLLEQIEARAADMRSLAPAGAPVLLRHQTWSGNPNATALLTAHGYRLERVFRLMQIDVTPETPLPEVAPPAGIVIRPFVRGQDEQRAWLADEESFQDHWNHHPTDFDTWLRFQITARESFDPTVWWLAMAGDEVAGVAMCDPDAPGAPEYGWVATLGVRRPWRGRGIATALLATAFDAFRRRGKIGVRLGVDANSPTGAYRLYERAGMRAISDVATYVKELAPAG